MIRINIEIQVEPESGDGMSGEVKDFLTWSRSVIAAAAEIIKAAETINAEIPEPARRCRSSNSHPPENP